MGSPVPGEVVLWRFHGTAGFRTPAWNEMYCYEGCGCRPYVAVPLAQREVERRVLEAAIRWLSARQDDAESIVVLLDATKAYAALRGKEAPRG